MNGSDRQCLIPVGFNNTGQGWWNEADQAATVRKGDEHGGGGAREATVIAFDFKQGLAPHGACKGENTASQLLASSHKDMQCVLAFGGNNTSAPIDVATACNAKGGVGRQDFDTETFVCSSHPSIVYQDSEFGCQGYETAGSMRAGRIPEHQMVLEPVCYGLQTDVTPKFNEDLSFTLKQPSKSGGGQPAAVAFTQNQCGDVLVTPHCPSIGTNSNATGRNTPKVFHGAMQVRRLTCVECERLMDAPDGYTAWGIDDNGNRVEMADGPRYKMIGNGVGVPHSRWIGNRALASLKQ